MEKILKNNGFPGDPAGIDLGAGPLQGGDALVVGHLVGEEIEGEEHHDSRELRSVHDDQRLHVVPALDRVSGIGIGRRGSQDGVKVKCPKYKLEDVTCLLSVERAHGDGAAEGGDEVKEELGARGHHAEVEGVRQQQERQQVT